MVSPAPDSVLRDPVNAYEFKKRTKQNETTDSFRRWFIKQFNLRHGPAGPLCLFAASAWKCRSNAKIHRGPQRRLSQNSLIVENNGDADLVIDLRNHHP